jgi:hypothetical protein
MFHESSEFTNCFDYRRADQHWSRCSNYLCANPDGGSAMSDLLDRTIEAHSGLERWRGVRAIDVVFNFSGGLLDLKGFPGHHRPAVSVDALKPRAVLQRLSGDPDATSRPIRLRKEMSSAL